MCPEHAPPSGFICNFYTGLKSISQSVHTKLFTQIEFIQATDQIVSLFWPFLVFYVVVCLQVLQL